MKLVDVKKGLSKEFVFDTYIRIVYDYIDYEEITRKEMLKEIVDMYHDENFMYYICTQRELEFIEKFYSKKIKNTDANKYLWEINELDKKFIFDKENLVFYEDYDDIIPNLIEYCVKNKKDDFPLSMFIVSLVRIHGEMILKVVKSLSEQIYDINMSDFDNYLGNPLVHFYCDYDMTELSYGKEETIYFRDYYDDLYELKEQRKKLGGAYTLSIDKNLFKDFYYYGMNYSNPIVKKMYDKLVKDDFFEFEMHIIDKCRLLGIPYRFPVDSEIVNNALQEIPCAAMNGVSPKQREIILSESEEIEEKFSCVPQNNAHVHKSITRKFYYYYFALLEYTNNKYKINKNIKKIFKQEGLNPYELSSIDDYLWDHKEEVIDNFIKDNVYEFNDNDFYYINQFRTGLQNKNYVFVGTEREYAKFLSEDGKIYMVKGLTSDLDKVLDLSKVPYIIETHLLMFENYIIYTGMISNYELDFGNQFKKDVLKQLKNALCYYHF